MKKKQIDVLKRFDVIPSANRDYERFIDARLDATRQAAFATLGNVELLKPYQDDQSVILIGFYYIKEGEKVFLTVSELDLKCRRRQLLYRDIYYDIVKMVISEEHAYQGEQFGFVAFTNHNKENTPYFAYNQYPKMKNPKVAESKFSWDFLEIGDYFLGEPINSKPYFDIYYAMLLIEFSDRIPKTVFHDIRQDLKNLYL